MGNAASNANNRPPGAANRRLESPIRRSSQSPGPTTPSSNQAPHRSLRTKKKSLELPDLASLAITSSPHQNYPYSGTHRTSSPIPIPFSPHLNSSTPRRQHNFPSTHQLPDVFVEHPSTHNPISPKRRVNPFFRGAPLQYNSTRSFTSKPHQHHQAPTRMQEPTTTPPPVFVPETVHSTIPIALEKAESASSQGLTPKRQHASDDSQDPVSVKITWHGGGKSVILARAGDDDWKGRTVMEREIPTSDQTWFTWVVLAPGTHHLRFLVDGQWRVADDLPTAVDDEGSLANYVAVALYTPPSTASASSSAAVRPLPGQSFWSTSSGDGPSGSSSDDRRSGPLRWTSEFPPELLAAAHEEENYLASSVTDSGSSSGVPAPNIPPAPTLPRHLDKLILNVRPNTNGPAQAGRTRDRDREREERRSSGKKSGRSMLGMTSTTNEDGMDIPVTTASGADITTPGGAVSRARLDGLGMTDDASVLPVPSHVVLHHLSTSAIRNGVLAVGNTTRYRKKYLTTIYYKPT